MSLIYNVELFDWIRIDRNVEQQQSIVKHFV